MNAFLSTKIKILLHIFAMLQNVTIHLHALAQNVTKSLHALVQIVKKVLYVSQDIVPIIKTNRYVNHCAKIARTEFARQKEFATVNWVTKNLVRKDVNLLIFL